MPPSAALPHGSARRRSAQWIAHFDNPPIGELMAVARGNGHPLVRPTPEGEVAVVAFVERLDKMETGMAECRGNLPVRHVAPPDHVKGAALEIVTVGYLADRAVMLYRAPGAGDMAKAGRDARRIADITDDARSQAFRTGARLVNARRGVAGDRFDDRLAEHANAKIGPAAGATMFKNGSALAKNRVICPPARIDSNLTET